MRWSAAALLLLGCTRTAAPDAVTPLDVPPVPRAVEDAKLPLAHGASIMATWPTHAGDMTWLKTVPKATAFARIDGLADAPSIALTWRVHPSRRVPGTEDEKDAYASLYEAKVELVLAGGAREKTIDLGLHSGTAEGGSLSSCERAGYRHGNPENHFGFADMPSRVAYWEMGTTQGGSELLLLLGTGKIHVLRRHTHDGACPVMKKQGPLEVCADMAWEQLAEIPVTGEPRVSERAVELDEAGAATPFDCKAGYFNEDLVAPDP